MTTNTTNTTTTTWTTVSEFLAQLPQPVAQIAHGEYYNFTKVNEEIIRLTVCIRRNMERVAGNIESGFYAGAEGITNSARDLEIAIAKRDTLMNSIKMMSFMINNVYGIDGWADLALSPDTAD